MRGLKDPTKRRALAGAMGKVLESGTGDERCVGALITCQRSSMSLERQALAYEYLHGTSAFALRPDVHRTSARAPGWRVLVPRAARAVEGRPPPGIASRRVAAGLLLEAGCSDPHEMTPAAMAALEEYLAASAAITRASKPA
jgi:hypothetical protein